MNPSPEKVREIIGNLIAAESGGEIIADERVIARHPTLADALPDALQSLSAIRTAELESRAAGAIPEPLEICSEDELLAPIQWDSSSDDSEPGRPREIAGRIVGYELLEVIGQGGQATVYRARKISTGGVVAIKVLPGGFFATSRARTRFDHEAKALVTIKHPNVVPVLDRGRTEDGSQFIVMEYVEGLPLDRFLLGSSDPVHIATIFAKIARAVEELHRCRILHRDLKPSNVMVDRYGEPKVLDFGLARIEEMPGVTDTGQVLGSLPWASPEQASGHLENVSERSDIYGIGIMLAYVLDGRLPYPTFAGPMEAARHICNTPARIGQGRSASPLDGIALKCLEKRPSDRYATASELAEQLERVAAGNAPLIALRRPRPSLRLLWVIMACVLSLALTLQIIPRLRGPATPAAGNVRTRQAEPVIELPAMTNVLGMRFVQIPAGTFTMGSPEREAGHQYDEVQKPVTISNPFFLAVTKVTQAQYQQVMQINPSDPRFLGPNLPVQRVSLQDANAFCDQLAKMDGSHRYRLPTEQEWEYAARASSDARVLSEADLSATAWWKGNSGGILHPVAQLAANRWGLYDMEGNVSEWCEPAGSARTSQKATDVFAFARGGSFDVPAASCRIAARRAFPRHSIASNLGFRVILVR